VKSAGRLAGPTAAFLAARATYKAACDAKDAKEAKEAFKEAKATFKAACAAAAAPAGRGIFWFYLGQGAWPARVVNYAGTGYPASLVLDHLDAGQFPGPQPARAPKPSTRMMAWLQGLRGLGLQLYVRIHVVQYSGAHNVEEQILLDVDYALNVMGTRSRGPRRWSRTCACRRGCGTAGQTARRGTRSSSTSSRSCGRRHGQIGQQRIRAQGGRAREPGGGSPAQRRPTAHHAQAQQRGRPVR
jgi:hypothetical protein